MTGPQELRLARALNRAARNIPLARSSKRRRYWGNCFDRLWRRIHADRLSDKNWLMAQWWGNFHSPDYPPEVARRFSSMFAVDCSDVRAALPAP